MSQTREASSGASAARNYVLLRNALPEAWRTPAVLEGLRGVSMEPLVGEWVPGPTKVFSVLELVRPERVRVLVISQEPTATGGHDCNFDVPALAAQGVLAMPVCLSRGTDGVHHWRIGWTGLVRSILRSVPRETVLVTVGSEANRIAMSPLWYHIRVAHPGGRKGNRLPAYGNWVQETVNTKLATLGLEPIHGL